MKTKTEVKEPEVKEEVKQEVAEYDARKEAATVYHSDLLKKYFKNYEDLEKEEAAYRQAHEKELQEKEEKEKSLANIKDLYKKYVDTIEAQQRAVAEAWENYAKARDEFADKYGGYRITYRSQTDSSGKKTEEVSINDVLEDFKRSYARVLSNFPSWFLD